MNSSSSTAPVEVEKTTFEDETIATAQECIPVPWTWGTTLIAGRFITPIYGERAQEVPSTGGSKSSKGGGGGKTYNYYGTIGVGVCIGPVDAITDLIEADETVGSWPVNRSGYSILATIPGGGKLRIHWGDTTQDANTALNAFDPQPPFKGQTYMVGEDYLFGKQQTSAPSWQIATKRTPVQTVITSTPAALDADGQANPAAIIAEVLTSTWGLGISASRLHTASWQSVAAALPMELHGISPSITRQTVARDFIGQVGSFSGLWVRRNAANLLELGRWSPPADTSGLISITAADLCEPLSIDTTDMDDLPTDYTVEFTDKPRAWKKGMERVVDVAAVRSETQLKTENVSYLEVVSRTQARKRMAEYMRQRRGGSMKGEAVLRRARGRALKPGDYFKLDVDPIPDASSSMLLVRCLRREFGPTGAVKIEWQAEPGAAPVRYVTPSSVVVAQVPPVIPPLTRPRIISLKPYSGESPAITVLAARPHVLASGYDCLFDTSTSSGTFPSIGSSTGFALPVSLATTTSAAATTVRVNTFAEFSTGKPANLDKWIISDGIGVGNTEAADDRMVLVLLARDTSTGAIKPYGSGKYFEVMAISAASLVASDTWDLTVLRGRMGTAALPFDATTGATFPDAFTYFEGWVIQGQHLQRFTHRDLATLARAGTAATLRLRPWAISSVYDPSEAFDAGLQAADAWDNFSYTFPSDDLYPLPPDAPITDPIIVNTISAPSISPSSQLFTSSVVLSVSAQAGLVVRYSTSGDVTSTSSEWPKSGGSYTTLTLTSSTTLRVRAFSATTTARSDQVSQTYTRNSTNPKVATPYLSGITSIGEEMLFVNLGCATSGATIYHAISEDGGETWSAWSTTVGFGVATYSLIKAYAKYSTWDQSDLLEYQL